MSCVDWGGYGPSYLTWSEFVQIRPIFVVLTRIRPTKLYPTQALMAKCRPSSLSGVLIWTRSGSEFLATPCLANSTISQARLRIFNNPHSVLLWARPASEFFNSPHPANSTYFLTKFPF